MIGFCLGGTLLATALGYLAAKGDTRLKSATFFATLIDFSKPGELEVFIDEPQVEALKKGEDVRLVGFGTFLPVKREAGTARNPRTGQQVARPASTTARFRVGEGLKGALNG